MDLLPEEIIDLSIKKLHCVEDIVRCSAVCKVWRSIVAEIQKKPHKVQFSPWLMLSPPLDHQETPLFQKFFNFAKNKLVNMELQHTKGRRCWGSPFGWILTLGFDLNIHLLNPLSQIQMSLPSLVTLKHLSVVNYTPETLRSHFLCRLVLSSHPSNSAVQVMAIFGGQVHLAFAKPGDEFWTSVSKPETVTCEDAIFFKGEFYVVTILGQLMICDTTHTNSPSATHFSSPPEGGFEGSFYYYLVEMDGNLLIIARNLIGCTDEDGMDSHHMTIEFVAHKLDFHSKSWTYLQTLGDYALFLGNNTSFAISTIEHPSFKGNCIYFTDDHSPYELPFCDMGVYDYDQHTVDVLIHVGDDVGDDVDVIIHVDDDVRTMFDRPFFFVPGF